MSEKVSTRTEEVVISIPEIEWLVSRSAGQGLRKLLQSTDA